MSDLAACIVQGVEIFALVCLAGMIFSKIRPAASPLWATLAVCGCALLLFELDGGGSTAGVCLGGFGGFAYLEWRAAHRPAVVAWPSGKVGAAGLLLVLVVAAAVGLLQYRAREGSSAKADGLPPGVIPDPLPPGLIPG